MHMFQTVNSNYLWGEVSGLKMDEMNRRLQFNLVTQCLKFHNEFVMCLNVKKNAVINTVSSICSSSRQLSR